MSTAPYATVSITLSIACINEILSNEELVSTLSTNYPRDLKKLLKQQALANAGASSIQYVPKNTGVLTLEQKVKKGLATPEEEAAYWESTI
jgi:hypothetical protein